jgi:branched-subunit amino acid aminotransferase/4-amino-4-deoxychorismate lyase
MTSNDISYLAINGEIINSNDLPITIFTNILEFPLIIKEDIRCIAANILFFDNHYELLSQKIKKIHPQLEPARREILFNTLTRLLTKNRLFGGGVIHLIYYKNNKNLNYIAYCKSLSEKNFELNNKGLIISIITNTRKVVNHLPILNSIDYYFTDIIQTTCLQKELNDCLIANEKNCIIHGSVANVYFVIGKKLYYPPLKEGANDDVMRTIIIQLAQKAGIETLESFISTTFLFQADEIFFADNINGIRWIVAFNEKRYYNKTSKILHQLLIDCTNTFLQSNN